VSDIVPGCNDRDRFPIPPVGNLMASDANVLFITADQWRGDCLGAAAHPVVRTRTSTASRPAGSRSGATSPKLRRAGRAGRRSTPACTS